MLITLSRRTAIYQSIAEVINYVRMILAIFAPRSLHGGKIFQTPPPYSYVRFHFFV